MHRRKSSGKTGSSNAIVATIAFLLLALSFGQHAKAQNADGRNPVRFAGIASGTAFKDVDKIITNPEVTIATTGCQVVGFTFSVAPSGDYIYGPFKTEGNKLRQEQVDWLKTKKGTSMKIFLEDIKLKCGDKTMMETPVVYSVKP